MRITMLAMALLFLTSLTGCGLTGGCGASGCGKSGCGASGCGAGAGVGGRLANVMHSHGICDCEFDDHCSSRSPWVRNVGGVGPALAPASEQVAPPAKLPDVKSKGL